MFLAQSWRSGTPSLLLPLRFLARSLGLPVGDLDGLMDLEKLVGFWLDRRTAMLRIKKRVILVNIV